MTKVAHIGTAGEVPQEDSMPQGQAACAASAITSLPPPSTESNPVPSLVEAFWMEVPHPECPFYQPAVALAVQNPDGSVGCLLPADKVGCATSSRPAAEVSSDTAAMLATQHMPYEDLDHMPYADYAVSPPREGPGVDADQQHLLALLQAADARVMADYH
mmetsp:Transcript_18013/g.30787  ORF Transcript_18013/g.30787 Transcript_18013/m.30787 type:complete len:160 (+) Transcript_18013:236-715(+)|eukprot:CAMPEP_0119102338 /NCGR_PEP_ID=MMETSP1180-20130426/1115_1 /TAXON_ID=3052 ORGANISM="Chlamydomonas cf sp, Strain CCMP681" /NCGR_SAMPLE_ID=MMETSP1180 /ASSEMBLY_ACC=CAM_ASM_000741 /LENGTH=159 /DNA_ID=CAMNT_0007086599 /DNA_START=108 /DNA_END=587 /DNA_ORIENTATION=-